ncbi:MAG TPA: response regulator [Bacillota bacterium]|jgi:diguanylate cyclase (GGDEF)-like protein|nr:response regulator [Bacillota bacterium]HOL08887.1 response regulator [Bacillota bacterium]HPO96580.1 response regulator [Bacillota bacterium]
MEGEKILIAEADPKVIELATIKLSNAGYLVITLRDGTSVLEKASSSQPDLFLISAELPGKSGYEICYELNQKTEFKSKPIVLMIDQTFDEAQFKATGIKVDDFLVKPFTPKNLLSKVNQNITKYRLLKQINPHTLLPGKTHLVEKVDQLIADKASFDLAFCDLKDFKIYNKIYGYGKGNSVISYLAKLLQEELDKFRDADGELYHFGGDDFCVLMKAGYAEEFCRETINRFDMEILEYYEEEDRKRHGLVINNRRGMLEQYPFMTLDFGIVSNQHRVINNWFEAEAIGSELLRFGKTIQGSHFIRDRRKS